MADEEEGGGRTSSTVIGDEAMGGRGRRSCAGARSDAGLEVDGTGPAHGGVPAASDGPRRVATGSHGVTAAGSRDATAVPTVTMRLRVPATGGWRGMRARGWGAAAELGGVAGAQRRSAVA
jgi:hypothetical protein